MDDYNINYELVVLFLNDKKLWNNLNAVLYEISKKDPIRLAQLNEKITSFTLVSLENQKREKQFALSQLYMVEPKQNPLLFFELFYASKELYSDPKSILGDCASNQDTFKLFISLYRNRNNLENWRKNYDKDNWLDKLDTWLQTDEAKKFLNEDTITIQ